MKSTTFATALLLLPSYLVFAWVYVFNAFPRESQAEKIAIYKNKLLPLGSNPTYLSVLGIVAALLAIIIFIKSSEGKSTTIKIYSYILSIFATGLALILFSWMM